MLRKLSFCALIILALPALAGCGTGAQPTALPVPATAAPTATTTGPITPAPMGGTPLPFATHTAAVPPSPTAPLLTPTGALTLTAIPTETAAMTEETPTGSATPPETPPTGGAATPGATPGGSAATPGATPSGMTVEVISFNVWQDFMPRVGTSGPPLNASVELNVTNHSTTPLGNVLPTRIVVRRPDGEVILDRGVVSNTPDTDPTGDLAPGETRHYSVRAAPSDTAPTLIENEAVSGTLTLSAGSAEQPVPLPATRVLFTH